MLKLAVFSTWVASVTVLAACGSSNKGDATLVEIPGMSSTPVEHDGPTSNEPRHAVQPSVPPRSPEASSSGRPSPSNLAAAQALFDEGRDLMRQGRIPEACAKLEASATLDRAVGTLLNLAKCKEQAGDPAGRCATLSDALPLIAPGDARERFVRDWAARSGC